MAEAARGAVYTATCACGIYQRWYWGCSIQQGTGPSSAEFYFSHHNPEYDCLYNGEFEAYVEGGTLTKLHPAFSHIGDARKYVHHRTTADDIRIWKHLNENNSRIYVCRSADG
ncbi:hypothetical protein GQ54DRAFT_307363 [Martensiomyces pterosporus]|nr:hypothetical protein GQ54DRAFT_307363 [Martensiomyces pterosporus]